MSNHRLIQELTEWTLDNPGAAPPPLLQQELDRSPALADEWRKTRQWIEAVHRPESWQGDDDFFARLNHNAMREKRRAALTEPTRRELSLDWLSTSWFEPIFTWKRAFAAAAAVMLIVPVFYLSFSTYTHIGQVEFARGAVIQESFDDPYLASNSGIHRGQTLQTTTDAQSVIELDNGVRVYVDARSRLQFNGPKQIALHVGRAYFDVPKGTDGFTVTLPHGEVRVIGTAFAIEIKPENSQVTVSRGVVEVSNQDEHTVVRQGNETRLAKNGLPAIQQVPQINTRINWVAKLHKDWNEQDMKRYFPSLAAPEANGEE